MLLSFSFKLKPNRRLYRPFSSTHPSLSRVTVASCVSLHCLTKVSLASRFNFSKREGAIMLVYQDIISGDQLLSDSFPYKEIENGMLWEVEGKSVVQGAVSVDLGANPAEAADEDEGVDNQDVKVIDIVDTFKLQQLPAFDEKQFVAYIKRFIKNLTPKLDADKQETFKKNIWGAIEFLFSKLKDQEQDLLFFIGESINEDGCLVFAYYKDDSNDPTFVYLAYALKEVKC